MERQVFKAFDLMRKRGWDAIYWAIDLHDTCIVSNYNANDLPTDFLPGAKEVLRRISKRPDCRLIMYTCSYPHEIVKYLKFFEEHGIHFSYVNKNPEVPDTAFGFFQDKFYFNILLDDKAGFDGESDWFVIDKALDAIDKTNNK